MEKIAFSKSKHTNRNTMATSTGAETIADVLKALGVDTVFGLVGIPVIEVSIDPMTLWLYLCIKYTLFLFYFSFFSFFFSCVFWFNVFTELT